MNWNIVIQAAIAVAVASGAQYLADGGWQSAVASALVTVAALFKSSPLSK